MLHQPLFYRNKNNNNKTFRKLQTTKKFTKNEYYMDMVAGHGASTEINKKRIFFVCMCVFLCDKSLNK